MGNLNYIISLQALLKGRNVDFDNTPAKNIRLVRHADSRVGGTDKDKKELRIEGKTVPAGISNLYELYIYHRDLFDKYISEQKRGRFDKIKYLVFFIGETGTSSRFIGVYEIRDRKPSLYAKDEEILNLKRVLEFQFLEEKIIIDWGRGTRNWCHLYENTKEVIRIEEGITKADGTPVFKSYGEVILNHRQLVQVLKDSDWIKALKALNCIYLIEDKDNGRTYVGSTYGKDGIYGRWKNYAETGHGNDVELQKLVNSNPKYHELNFQWSILETLNYNITEQEAIERENLWKRKLLSLEHGYNRN